MAYASANDLIERFGSDELAQAAYAPDNPAGYDTEKVARVLVDASREIDSYVAVRYAVPLASPPGVVLKAACVIARYRLHDDRATDRIRQDYEDMLRWLRDVAAGKALLDVDTPAVSVGGSLPRVSAPGVVFTDQVVGSMP